MRFRLMMTLFAFVTSSALLSSGIQAETAPVLDLTSGAYVTSSPQTLTGMGQSATIAFGGGIYVAFQSHSGNYLWVELSSDGQHYTNPGTAFKSILMSYAPSILEFNNLLYVAYTTPSGGIDVIDSGDGVSFSAPVSVYAPTGIGTDVPVTSPPTLAVFNGALYVFWESNYTITSDGVNYNDNMIQSSVTPDGVNWTEGNGDGALCNYGWNNNIGELRPMSNSAVGAAVFNGNLYVAAQLGSGADGSNELAVCSTATGYNYYPSIMPGSGISATVYNGSLYLAFKYNHSGNELELTGTEDGTNFTTPVTSYGNDIINGNNEIAPSIIPFNGELYVYFTKSDSAHELLVSHSY